MSSARRLPSLDLLKGFEAAARLGSFTRAAAELHLTQSAISRQVQVLEEQLGVRLFERSTRSLALTPAGARLQRAAGEVLQRLRDVVDALHAEAGGRSPSPPPSPSPRSGWCPGCRASRHCTPAWTCAWRPTMR